MKIVPWKFKESKLHFKVEVICYLPLVTEFDQFPDIWIRQFYNKLKWTCQSVKRCGNILRANYYLFGKRSDINWKPVVNLCIPRLKFFCIISVPLSLRAVVSTSRQLKKKVSFIFCPWIGFRTHATKTQFSSSPILFFCVTTCQNWFLIRREESPRITLVWKYFRWSFYINFLPVN